MYSSFVIVATACNYSFLGLKLYATCALSNYYMMVVRQILSADWSRLVRKPWRVAKGAKKRFWQVHKVAFQGSSRTCINLLP